VCNRTEAFSDGSISNAGIELLWALENRVSVFRALLNPHGRLLLALSRTPGDDLVEQRDASGRLFKGHTF
jgi:hypothetical protein